jgi:ABC-type sugar transport system permease subunit
VTDLAETTAAPARRMRLSTEEHARLQRHMRRRRNLVAFGFLLPNAIVFTAFLLIPIVMLFFYTFHDGGIISPRVYVGLDNWQRVFSDPLVRRAIRNTTYYVLIAIPTVFIMAMIMALCLQRIIRGGSAFRSLFYLPTLTPYVVAALIWQFMFHRDFGLLNIILTNLGFQPQNWLGNPDLVIPSIAMLEIWRGFGFWTLLFLAALLALPKELYQAAELDGASAVRRLIHLTIPLMRPTFFFAIVMATIWNFQLFDSVSILTDGGPQESSATVVWYIYKSTFQFSDRVGFGAALSFSLLMFILALALVEIRLLRRPS